VTTRTWGRTKSLSRVRCFDAASRCRLFREGRNCDAADVNSYGRWSGSWRRKRFAKTVGSFRRPMNNQFSQRPDLETVVSEEA
jgi:hypothetical protein